MEQAGSMELVKKRKTSYARKREYMGLVYILPWVIGFLVFQLYPFVSSMIYSLTDYNMITEPQFIGIRNYVEIFTKDPDFKKSLGVTLRYAAWTIPAKLIFSLMIAMLMSMKLRFMNIYRTIYYLPSIFGGGVAISLLWRFLFGRDGVINRMLASIGLPAVLWLGSPKYALFTISLISIWEFGSSMVIFLAALKQVPEELYESARVEGAGRVLIFLKITLPFLSPMILFNTVMTTINTFQQFTSAFVVTAGGPVKSTFMYVLKLYNDAFLFSRMGYASALSWVLFGIIMFATILIFKFGNGWVYYGGDES